MRVARLRMLTGVLKLDYWGSRKVAFTFGAFTSDICVRRVPCFDHLFRYFLREKLTFFRLLWARFKVKNCRNGAVVRRQFIKKLHWDHFPYHQDSCDVGITSRHFQRDVVVTSSAREPESAALNSTWEPWHCARVERTAALDLRWSSTSGLYFNHLQSSML